VGVLLLIETPGDQAPTAPPVEESRPRGWRGMSSSQQATMLTAVAAAITAIATLIGSIGELIGRLSR